MTRSPNFRLHIVLVAAVFTAAGGLTGFDTHALRSHGPDLYDFMAMEPGPAHHASADGAHHPGHPEHGSSTHCTCLGACQGGGAPALSGCPTVAAGAGDVVVHRRPGVADFVPRRPCSHLLPFPNPPPTRA